MSAWIAAQSAEAQALLAVAVIWLAGFLMTRATKAFGLPNVTGYILAGVVIGPHCLNMLPDTVTGAMSFMTDAALAVIAFGVGRYLSLSRLRGQGGRIIVLTLMESLVAAAVVTLVMLLVFRLPLSFSLLLGAIASATAPASSLMTIRQYRAKGVFVDTLIQVVALDDAVSLLAFSACAAVATQAELADAGLREALVPLGLSLAMMLAAYLLGRLLTLILQGRSADHRIVLTLTFIFAMAGLCAALNISPLLGCMVMGATYMNLTGDKTLFKQVNRVSPPINMMFFVLSGMRLNLPALATAGVIGVTYFAVRILGKFGGAWLGGRLIHAPDEVRRYLGLALIPQAGVSIGLAVLAQRMLPPDTGTMLSTVILSSSVLYEMIGPLCARQGLVLAGAIPRGAMASPLRGLMRPPAGKTAQPAATAAPAEKSSAAPGSKAARGDRPRKRPPEAAPPAAEVPEKKPADRPKKKADSPVTVDPATPRPKAAPEKGKGKKKGQGKT